MTSLRHVTREDFGTSLWQLTIESYTNFPCVRKGPAMSGAIQSDALMSHKYHSQ